MSFFKRKQREPIDCVEECDEIERRGCDECLLQPNCNEVYKNTDHTECWQCRYKDYEQNKCLLRDKEV